MAGERTVIVLNKDFDFLIGKASQSWRNRNFSHFLKLWIEKYSMTTCMQNVPARTRTVRYPEVFMFALEIEDKK